MFFPYPYKLQKSIFLKRENRFILTCVLEETKENITVHLQDPGRLKELLIPGQILYVSYHNKPERKTKWTAELIQKPNSIV
jgi:sugar fermentation stimulation protein A